jgi:uncharacterized protein YjaZ
MGFITKKTTRREKQMSNAKKITLALLIVGLLAGIALVVFVVVRPLLTQPDNFVIVPAFEGQAEYIAAVRADPSADKDALYQKYVTDRYRESCGSNGLVSVDPMRTILINHPIGDLDQLEEGVQIIREADIVQLAKTALQKSSTLLPGSKITACLFVLDPDQQGFVSLYMHGVYGFTFSPAQIVIGIAHRNEEWRDWAAYTVAHEYGHAIFFQKFCEPQCTQADWAKIDLLDTLLFEGRADSFARTLYPNLEAPWVTALTPEQEAAQWRGIQEYLTSTSPNDWPRFLYGDGNQIPHWTGYTIGFHIVQKYIQSHPRSSPAEWIKLGSRELLTGGGYSGQR